jgi:formamidopyrimidine-DNA glycosylase
MPEMADVEVLKRRFNDELKGQKITGVKILNKALVKTTGLVDKLTGNKILESRRYGKYLFVQIDGDGWLVMHFGLTGHLIFEKGKEKKPSSRAMMVIFTDKLDLIYEATHVFGMAAWCDNPEAFIKEKKMGPDAAEASEDDFLEIMQGLKGAVKPALMDQHKLAGVGNVYADEVLFQAGIHPQTSIKNLTAADLKKIHSQIHRVHEAAVKVGAVRTQMPPWALMRVRKTTQICPKCGKKVKNVLVNNRETLFCPHCQPLKSH